MEETTASMVNFVDLDIDGRRVGVNPFRFSVGRTNNAVPDIIVMHTTTASTISALRTARTNERRGSYHFIIAGTNANDVENNLATVDNNHPNGVRDGTIIMCTPITDTAFSNGTSVTPSDNAWYGNSTHPLVRDRGGNANRYTIGIGFGDMNWNRGELTAAQINSAANLLYLLREQVQETWGHWIEIARDTANMAQSTVIGHSDVTPVSSGRNGCPILPPATSFPFTEIINRLNSLPVVRP